MRQQAPLGQLGDRPGDLIGEIHLPGAVNFCFGGPGRNLLFITTDTAVWAAVLRATAPEQPPTATTRRSHDPHDRGPNQTSP